MKGTELKKIAAQGDYYAITGIGQAISLDWIEGENIDRFLELIDDDDEYIDSTDEVLSKYADLADVYGNTLAEWVADGKTAYWIDNSTVVVLQVEESTEEPTEVHLISVDADEEVLESCKNFFFNNREVLDGLANSPLSFNRISFDNVPSQHHVIESSKYHYVQSELGWAAYPTDQFKIDEAVRLEFEIEE